MKYLLILLLMAGTLIGSCQPGGAETVLLQGAVEMRFESGRMAGNSYAVFLAKYPDHPQRVVALVGVADAKVKRNDWAGAHQAYQQALAADPIPLDLPKVLFHLGYSAEMIGNDRKARHYYHEVIRLFADSPYAARAKQSCSSA